MSYLSIHPCIFKNYSTHGAGRSYSKNGWRDLKNKGKKRSKVEVSSLMQTSISALSILVCCRDFSLIHPEWVAGEWGKRNNPLTFVFLGDR
jgi:hypothetical protein